MAAGGSGPESWQRLNADMFLHPNVSLIIIVLNAVLLAMDNRLIYAAHFPGEALQVRHIQLVVGPTFGPGIR